MQTRALNSETQSFGVLLTAVLLLNTVSYPHSFDLARVFGDYELLSAVQSTHFFQQTSLYLSHIDRALRCLCSTVSAILHHFRRLHLARPLDTHQNRLYCQ